MGQGKNPVYNGTRQVTWRDAPENQDLAYMETRELRAVHILSPEKATLYLNALRNSDFIQSVRS